MARSTIHYGLDDDVSYRPTWDRSTEYVNEEHRSIYEDTQLILGWGDPIDAWKLYEMGYYSGDAILEIGVYAGRSATASLRGALAGYRERGGSPPQYYGVDPSPDAYRRLMDTLGRRGLEEYSIFYHGDIAQFHHDLPIVPTMVFVDGLHSYAGVWKDLETLSRFLVPGTPVYCHDLWAEGVQAAVEYWINRGAFQVSGRFAYSVLLESTMRRDAPQIVGLDRDLFQTTQAALKERYANELNSCLHVPISDLTNPAREFLCAMNGETRATTSLIMGPITPVSFTEYKAADLPTLLSRIANRMQAGDHCRDIIGGSLDGVVDGAVTGWIWSPILREERLTVDIFDGCTKLGSAVANEFRSDLISPGTRDGFHAFVFQLDRELFDGQTHALQVKLQGSEFSLRKEPLLLDLLTISEGVEFSDCSLTTV